MTAGVSYRHSVTDSEAAVSLGASAAPTLSQVSDSVALNVTRPLYGDLTGRASVGYRWLDRGDGENAVGLEDSNGYTMSLGLSGQFLPRKYFPKTTGSFNIGYEDSQSPGLNDDSPRRLIGSLSLTWEARDTTSVSLSFSRSQSLTATDETSVNNGVNLSVSQAVGHFVSCSLDVGYTQSQFDDSGFSSVNAERSDDVYSAGIGIAYQINLSWSAGFNYRFVNSQSSLETSSYDRHTVKLSATYVF
jgi:opacity protein-like surface antigen